MEAHQTKIVKSRKLRTIGWITFGISILGWGSLVSFQIYPVQFGELTDFVLALLGIITGLAFLASFLLFIVASYIHPVEEFNNIRFWLKRIVFDCALAFLVIPMIFMALLLPFSLFGFEKIVSPEGFEMYTPVFDESSPLVMFLLLLITQVSMGLVVFFRHHKLPSKVITASIKNWKKDLKIVLLLTFMMIGISMVYGITLTLLKVDMPPQFQFSPEIKQQFWMMMILGGIGAPLVEELFFRGYLLSILKEKNKWIGLVLSSFIFGAAHLQPLYFPVLFAFGMILGWSYLRTKNILVPMSMHALNNLLAFALLLATQ